MALPNQTKCTGHLVYQCIGIDQMVCMSDDWYTGIDQITKWSTDLKSERFGKLVICIPFHYSQLRILQASIVCPYKVPICTQCNFLSTQKWIIFELQQDISRTEHTLVMIYYVLCSFIPSHPEVSLEVVATHLEYSIYTVYVKHTQNGGSC